MVARERLKGREVFPIGAGRADARSRPPPLILGCDFTSSPSRRKPVVVALGRASATQIPHQIGRSPASNGHIQLQNLERFETLEAFGAWLNAAPTPWVGAFDLPFGLPRELVASLEWPSDWLACQRHYASLSREEIRATFAAFCASRPAGAKFAHRATDGPAGSSPSMKWVNPPVAFMLHAGVPLLLAAGAHLPGLHEGDPGRVALEAYPGLLARQALATVPGSTRSYKADDRARQTPERLIARRSILAVLESGELPWLRASGLRLRLTHAQRDALADDASGDTLDAVLCLVQAAWAARHETLGTGPADGPGWGLPAFDALEGWIVGA